MYIVELRLRISDGSWELERLNFEVRLEEFIGAARNAKIKPQAYRAIPPIRAENPQRRDSLAEGVGFEPASDFRRCRFSGPSSCIVLYRTSIKEQIV